MPERLRYPLHYSRLFDSYPRLIAEKHGSSEPQVAAILTDFLTLLHEATYKGSITDVLLGVRFGIGEEASYHWGGAIHEIFDAVGAKAEAGEWLEAIARFDPNLRRFGSVVERRQEEIEEDIRIENEKSGGDSERTPISNA